LLAGVVELNQERDAAAPFFQGNEIDCYTDKKGNYAVDLHNLRQQKVL
jgi:hypothetical protein